MIPDVEFGKAPYVVLVGNVGAGKSTIVEKLTGITGRSSTTSASFTRSADYFWVPDKSLLIADTPGANPRKEKMEHNIEIAGAFNYRPVSKLFIVARADTRLDQTLSNVTEYADRFVSLPMKAVSVLVTHMDIEKEWSEQEFQEALDEELGIEDSVYSGSNSSGDEILKSVLDVCRDTYQLNVTSESFLRLFKISNSNRKILKVTEDIVYQFKCYKECFDVERAKFSEKEKVDLYFEFKTFMGERIEVAKKEMSEQLGFDYYGEKGVSEAGHLANMVNQLRAILYDIRAEALAYQKDHGVTQLRKCPYCPRIWAKVEGCDGSTTCGNRPSVAYDVRDSSFSVLATFTFDITTRLKLRISRNGTRGIRQVNLSNSYDGCGRSIVWNEMQIVQVPSEFRETPGINTDDIVSLPSSARKVYSYLDKQLRAVGKRMIRRKKI